MTLILKIYLDMVKMSHHTKHEVSMSRHLKVAAQTHTHTHTQIDRQTVWKHYIPAYAGGNNYNITKPQCINVFQEDLALPISCNWTEHILLNRTCIQPIKPIWKCSNLRQLLEMYCPLTQLNMPFQHLLLQAMEAGKKAKSCAKVAVHIYYPSYIMVGAV